MVVAITVPGLRPAVSARTVAAPTSTRPGSENISADQWQELRDLIEQAGIDEKVVLDAAKVSALDFLPARDFPSIKKRLEKTIATKAAK